VQVVYDNLAWEAFDSQTSWQPCSEAQKTSVRGVILSALGGPVKPEGFLYGERSLCSWTLFNEHRPAPPSGDSRTYGQPRLPAMKAGALINCSGNVWSGTRNIATSGVGVVFVAIASQRLPPSLPKPGEPPKRPQMRHVAVVGLPNGQLSWAELMSKEEGLVTLHEPACRYMCMYACAHAHTTSTASELCVPREQCSGRDAG
jgi:hypothetical protein